MAGYGISFSYSIGAPIVAAETLLASEKPVGVVNTLVLTGANETPAIANLNVRISSYRGSVARGEQSSVVFVAPLVTGLIDALDARPNGDLLLTRSFIFESSGLTPLSTISLSYKELRYDDGPTNKSVSITGRSTISFAAAKAISTPAFLTKKQVINNKTAYVNFEVELKFLGDVNPDDTFTHDGRSYQIKTIFYQVNDKQQIATLQTLDIT